MKNNFLKKIVYLIRYLHGQPYVGRTSLWEQDRFASVLLTMNFHLTVMPRKIERKQQTHNNPSKRYEIEALPANGGTVQIANYGNISYPLFVHAIRKNITGLRSYHIQPHEVVSHEAADTTSNQ
jgi:hypothetical protein